MALIGKKINELESISSLTNDTVIPSVRIDGTVTEDTATKITLADLKSNILEGVQLKKTIFTDTESSEIYLSNLDANTIYQFGELELLSIADFTTSYLESIIYFETGDTFELTFVQEPVWITGTQPTFEPNKKYVINFKNGIASVEGIAEQTTTTTITFRNWREEIVVNTNSSNQTPSEEPITPIEPEEPVTPEPVEPDDGEKVTIETNYEDDSTITLPTNSTSSYIIDNFDDEEIKTNIYDNALGTGIYYSFKCSGNTESKSNVLFKTDAPMIGTKAYYFYGTDTGTVIRTLGYVTEINEYGMIYISVTDDMSYVEKATGYSDSIRRVDTYARTVRVIGPINCTILYYYLASRMMYRACTNIDIGRKLYPAYNPPAGAGLCIEKQETYSTIAEVNVGGYPATMEVYPPIKWSLEMLHRSYTTYMYEFLN